MSAPDQRLITFPSDISQEAVRERVCFRMIQPLKDILPCVKNTLESMKSGEIAGETERFLLTVPTADPLQLDPPQDCSTCDRVFDPADDNHSDTSGVRSSGLPLRLPCKHIICHGCLRAWLARAGSCPICRHKLTGRVFIEDEKDPRTEENSPSILEPVLNFGLRWLATVSAIDNTEEKTFGEFCAWAYLKETAEQRAAMKALALFGAFSTSVEEARLQGEFGQCWIAAFRKQREIERERQRADEGGNDDRGERYETDSEDERRRYKEANDTSEDERRRYKEAYGTSEDERRRYKEAYETDSEDERRRYKEAYDTSDVKERGLTMSDLEYSDYHDRFIRWNSDDEVEEKLGAEGEANE